MVFKIFISLILTTFCTLKKNNLKSFSKDFQLSCTWNSCPKVSSPFSKDFFEPFPKGFEFLEALSQRPVSGLPFFKKVFSFVFLLIFYFFLIHYLFGLFSWPLLGLLGSVQFTFESFCNYSGAKFKPFPKGFVGFDPFPKGFSFEQQKSKEKPSTKTSKIKKEFSKNPISPFDFLLLILPSQKKIN